MALPPQLGALQAVLRGARARRAWPRKHGDVETLRQNADRLKGLGIAEIVDHLDAYVRDNPRSRARVDFGNDSRAPLLITGGAHDHTVPASLSRKTFGKYAASAARTDYLELPGAAHLLMVGDGWADVAGRVYAWLESVGVTEVAPQPQRAETPVS